MRIAVLDIGGTFIKSAVYEDGVLHGLRETPTPKNAGGKGILDCAKNLLWTNLPFDAIGVSTAGQVDTDRGMIRYANENLPNYTGTRVWDILSAAFSVPVAVDNDVNMAAIGEGYLGAGKGEPAFLCLTYGTGIGGAIIEHGEVYRGSCYSAAEFGSIITHGEAVTAGGRFQNGIYEKYASTTALVRLAQAQDQTLRDGKTIFARLEDPAVKTVVDNWIGEILLGLGGLIHIFNPSCVVLGGGVMEQPYVLEQLQVRLKDYVMPSFLNVTLKRAALGNRAGMLGAAISAKHLL